jgi:hypothetical protein
VTIDLVATVHYICFANDLQGIMDNGTLSGRELLQPAWLPHREYLRVQEVLNSQDVGVKIATQLAIGNFHLALHYWLALYHQSGRVPGFSAQRALILACQTRGARLWYPALFILTAMLQSQVH